MSNIEIRLVDKAHCADINIPNEPFRIFGRFIPSYTDGKWSWTTERFAEESEMRFPDENYDYDVLAENSIFLGAYDGDTCIGLAILRHSWKKYLYLYDLKVNSAYRGRHIGSLLIDAAKSISREHGYRGIYTQGQDNNLAACLFYVKSGFRIGGLDTDVYTGTSQEGKADVLFYIEN